MYRKKIKYRDYHGIDREEFFDFNLSDAEIMELEADYDGSITQMLANLSEKDKPSEVIKTMGRIVLLSYGVISEDGRRFIKSDELITSFKQTEAYATLFRELTTNSVAAAKFFERVISNDIVKDT